MSFCNFFFNFEIFSETKIASMPVNKSLNIDNLVEATDGYSGAEIVGAFVLRYC